MKKLCKHKWEPRGWITTVCRICKKCGKREVVGADWPATLSKKVL